MNFARANAPEPAVSALWISVMAAASIASTLVLACAMPFEALAAFAALYFGRRDGIWLTTLCWAANQAIGFGVLRYPVEFTSLAWSPGLLLAALAALFGAQWIARRLVGTPTWVRAPIMLAVAFVTFKVVVLVFALMLGGVSTTLSPHYAGVQIVTDSAFLLAFLALHAALRGLGAPAAGALERAA